MDLRSGGGDGGDTAVFYAQYKFLLYFIATLTIFNCFILFIIILFLSPLLFVYIYFESHTYFESCLLTLARPIPSSPTSAFRYIHSIIYQSFIYSYKSAFCELCASYRAQLHHRTKVLSMLLHHRGTAGVCKFGRSQLLSLLNSTYINNTLLF